MLTHLPTQDRILLCATLLHIPRISLIFSLGTELEQHCMTPNTAFPTITHVSSVLKRVSTFWGHTDRWGHATDEPHFPTVHYCACPLTVPHCAVCSIGTCLPGAGCVETDLWLVQAGSRQHPASSPAPAQQVPTSPPPPTPTSIHHPHPATLVKVSYSILVHIIISDFSRVGNTISSSLLYAMFVLFQIYRAAMVGPVLARPLYNRSPPRVAAGLGRDAPWDAFPGRR